jgi:hypothetical protein
MELTNYSKKNLAVIQNFLLYAQMEEELGQTAIDYISEDHVDGEDSYWAIKERAESSEMILDEVFMIDDELETFPHTIYHNAEQGLIYAVSQCSDELRIYKLIGDQDTIAKEHRQVILEYVLSKVGEHDEVSLADIFMYGKFNELVSTVMG